MLGAVTTEVGECLEVHKFSYLGEGKAFIIQIIFQYRYSVAVNVRCYTVTCHTLNGG